MADFRTEIEALYQAEYGDRTDIVMRTLGITLGGAVLYSYTGWAASYLWGVIFASVHAVQWPYLRSKMKSATERDAVIGGMLFVAVHISFIWLPTYLASLADPGLTMVGMLVFVVTAMYHIRRADTALWLVIAQIVIFSASLVWISTAQIPRYEDPIVQLSVGIVTAMATIYIALTMMAAHTKQLELTKAARLLAQEQKMSAIGRLAGGVAHDFNNVLTVIKGNLELHQHLEEAEEKSEVLAAALKAAERAEGVIQQLLVYARKAPTNPQKVNANDMVDDFATLSKTMVPERIRFVCHKWPQPLEMELDERQLSAALLNILKNSIDAICGNGTITLEVTKLDGRDCGGLVTGRSLASGDYVAIKISDTGHGIPQDIIAKVSDPFFTTKELGKGTGLGLSMVQGFVERFNGGMSIESSSSGTVIVLFVPSQAQQVTSWPPTEK